MMVADLVAYNDLDPLGSECTSALQSLEQDLWHRLIETYGSNPDDPDRGVGIEQRLSGAFDARELARAVELDFQKDPRVNSTVVTVTQTDVGVYQVDIAVDGDAGQLGISLVGNSSGNVQRVS